MAAMRLKKISIDEELSKYLKGLSFVPPQSEDS